MNKKVIGGYVCVDLEGHYYIGSSGDIKSRRIHHRLGNNHLHTRLYMTKNVRYCKTLEQARKWERNFIRKLSKLGFPLLNKYLIVKGEKK